MGIKRKSGISYRSSGVDIESADKLKSFIAKLARKTYDKNVLEGVGPFSSVLRLDSTLVLATCDGVGTKILLATRYGRFRGLGYDLVAMNVNDVVAMHGKPLFFLDYIGVPKLIPSVVKEVVSGIVSACNEAGCSLVGGETAQMPDFYARGAFELVGFCIGVVDETNVPQPGKVEQSDVILAFPSCGPHSNGFSLIRKLLSKNILNPNTKLGGKRLIDIILSPTKIYVRDFFSFVGEFGYPKVSAHITGGGIPGNIKRVIPDGKIAVLRKETVYELDEKFCNSVFSHISNYVDEREMFNVFNMGLGFCMVVSPSVYESLKKKVDEKANRETNKRKYDLFAVGYIDSGRAKGNRVVIV